MGEASAFSAERVSASFPRASKTWPLKALGSGHAVGGGLQEQWTGVGVYWYFSVLSLFIFDLKY